MIIPIISFYKPQVVKKLWGEEVVIDNNRFYCGKRLKYYKANIKSSAHFHYDKSESMQVVAGSFNFYYWDNKGIKQCQLMKIGDCVNIPHGRLHQLEPLEDNSEMFECSTPHSDIDVYRSEPSQSI